MNKAVQYKHLGNIDYKEAWDYQEQVFATIIAQKIANRDLAPDEQGKTNNFLFFCEHPHVYTLGKRGAQDHLLLDNTALNNLNANYYEINRGGDITYHGPGQLVAYPLLDLDNFFTDIHKYMRLLEEAVILTLADFKLKAGRIEGLTGVWLDFEGGRNPRKIAAMGVKTSRWVTMHGLALNVNPDLTYFTHIVPCGITDKAVTSMQLELGQEIPITKVEESLKKHFAQLFEMELV